MKNKRMIAIAAIVKSNASEVHRRLSRSIQVQVSWFFRHYQVDCQALYASEPGDVQVVAVCSALIPKLRGSGGGAFRRSSANVPSVPFPPNW